MVVTFIDPNAGDAGAQEEVFDSWRPPRRRRWLGWALLGGVALLLSGVLAVERGGGHPTPSPSIGRTGSAEVPRLLRWPVLADAPAVVVDGTAVTISGDSLVWINLATSGVATARLGVTLSRYPTTLVADPPRHRVWLVRLASGVMTAIAYGSRDTEPLFEVGMRADADAAAVLDGGLYVSTDGGMRLVSTGSRGLTIRPVDLPFAISLAADPPRHRLLLVGRRVSAWRADRVTRVATAPDPFDWGQLAVVAGRIWAVGVTNHGAVLAQLDPQTLRPVRHSPLESRLGPGAVLAATGRHDLLVRTGAGSDALWCIDARSGAIVRAWAHVAGAAVLAPDGVYAISYASDPRKLAGGRCG